MRSPMLTILKREYMSRVTTKAFWIATAIFPILAIGVTIVPSILAARSKTSPDPVHVVDLAGDFFPVFKMVASKTSEGRENVPPIEQVQLKGRSIDEVRKSLNDAAEKGEIQGYLVVDADVLKTGELIFYARNVSSAVTADWLRSAARRSVTKYRLLKSGVPPKEIDDAIERISLQVQKATNDPNKKESGIAALFMTFGLVMFIYFALILYGIYVLRGVLEEKSNRIVEIMVSTVKPFELMLGKILGIGAVGLTQIAIWVTFATLFTAPQVAAALSISSEFRPAANVLALVFFPVYFVLGYFLYATMYAGIGAMFNSDEEAQQLAGAAQMMLVIPMMVLMPVIRDPNGTLSTALSLFPFFTPILMYLRIAIQTPPAWQIALSIVIMLVTILVMVWVVSKVYRIGILMYGKKPTIPEVVRWLRYT